jgi:propanol-preferring alcohol dehydrogenase
MSVGESMEAAVLKELNKPLVIERVPKPELRYGEVLVQTKACGICGTDLHIIDGTGYKPRLPHILGHEPAGVVVQISEGVTSIGLGDRVLPNIFFTCGECFYCRTNRETLCTNFAGALGVGINGGYAEYFKAPARNLFPLPENIAFPEGSVIADAVVTAVHAVRRRAQVRSGQIVLVIGTGGVGQSVIQIAKNAGARVFVVVRRTVRMQIAQKMTADETINSKEHDVAQKVKELTEGKGVDAVIDNVGSNETLLQALGSVRPGGRIVMVGETNDTIPLSTFRLCVNEFEIIGSRSGGRQDTIEAIDLVAKGIVTPYVSNTYPLRRINNAFDDIRARKVLGRAVIVMSEPS